MTSQLTIDEASRGDSSAANDRLELLKGIPLVAVNERVESVAGRLLFEHTLPEKAAADALHIAAAAVGNAAYLLTLNCKHIANAHELPRIYNLLEAEGFGRLLICTPAEFLGGEASNE